MSTNDFLTPEELVLRWNGAICRRTLANWRWKGHGPKFVKKGWSVLYPLREVKSFEKSNKLLLAK